MSALRSSSDGERPANPAPGTTGGGDAREPRPEFTRTPDGRIHYALFPKTILRKNPAAGADECPSARCRYVPKYVCVRTYDSPNWLTVQGVAAKRRQIEKKGIPDLTWCKFLTLTIDPDKFAGPCEAYLKAKARLREFVRKAIAAGIFPEGCAGFWKLEFHESGWPHWHMVVMHRPMWTVEQLRALDELWGNGWVNVEAIKDNQFWYLWKYCFKPPVSEDQRDPSGVLRVPDWFADYYQPATDGKPPQSFARVRFFQTFGDFYTGVETIIPPDPAPPKFSFVPRPVRDVHNEAKGKVQLISRKSNGRYLSSVVVALTSWQAFSVSASWDTLSGLSYPLGLGQFVARVELVSKHLKQPWLLQQLKKPNRLTPNRAAQLPQETNWRTC